MTRRSHQVVVCYFLFLQNQLTCVQVPLTSKHRYRTSVSVVARASDPSVLLLPIYVLYCFQALVFYIAEAEYELDSACDRHLFISRRRHTMIKSSIASQILERKKPHGCHSSHLARICEENCFIREFVTPREQDEILMYEISLVRCEM